MSHIPNNIHCPHKFIANLMGNYIPSILHTRFTEFAYYIVKTMNLVDTFNSREVEPAEHNEIGYIITVYKSELPEKYHNGYHVIIDDEQIAIYIDEYDLDKPSCLFTQLYVYITFNEFPLIERYMKLKSIKFRTIHQYDLLQKKYQLHTMF